MRTPPVPKRKEKRTLVITEYVTTVRENVAKARQVGKKIILIPTMGALHTGHLSLIELAKAGRAEEDSYVVMSIFVNPLQFGPGEDYNVYPRNLRRDADLASTEGVDLLFTPAVREMYPEERLETTVLVGSLASDLCGRSRPGHFNGVATVVNKLLSIVQPDAACFGQKDYQQFVILSRMQQDFNLPVKLLLAPIVREPSGLALSSRNAYLSLTQKEQAKEIYAALEQAATRIALGERDVQKIHDSLLSDLKNKTQGQVEYAEIRDKSSLAPVNELKASVVLMAAVRIGETRLIDNILVEV
jgi:pantoate--beta-alanine ligase